MSFKWPLIGIGMCAAAVGLLNCGGDASDEQLKKAGFETHAQHERSEALRKAREAKEMSDEIKTWCNEAYPGAGPNYCVEKYFEARENAAKYLH
jgi:hypothetical protein